MIMFLITLNLTHENIFAIQYVLNVPMVLQLYPISHLSISSPSTFGGHKNTLSISSTDKKLALILYD